MCSGMRCRIVQLILHKNSQPITGQLVVACGALLIYLEADSTGIKAITELECEFEISCIDITPVGKLPVIYDELFRKFEKWRLEVLQY